MDVPKDEAGNIAFHFINAQYDHPYNKENLVIQRTVRDILDIVKYSFGITYHEDSTLYSRYVTHVQLFGQKLTSQERMYLALHIHRVMEEQ